MSERWTVLDGDVRIVAAALEQRSFDAVLCDPPYELSDDGKASAARVALEVLFPEYPNVETNGASESDLALLIAEVLALSLGRLGPGPAASMPEVTMALDDDAAMRENDVEDTGERSVVSPGGNRLLNEKAKPTKYLGRFVLECADPAAALDAFNCAGTCLYSGSLRIGSSVSLASLPSLLRGGGVVDHDDPNVRALHDAFAAAVCATPRAEMLPVPSSLALARTQAEFLSTGSALALFGTLQLGGAKLVRASSRASGLPSKLQARRICIVCDAANRALSLDLILHPVNMASKGFMGKTWDGSKVAFDVATWAAILGCCKPGAHMLAFGGSRTMHRIACAIEDGGFQIRDTLMFLYGSGFPKSLDVSKAIDKAAGAERKVVGTKRGTSSVDGGSYRGGVGTKQKAVDLPATLPATLWDGWGTALKPSFEPLVLARVPLDGTIVANVLKWGCGALAIDACRIRTDDDLNGGTYSGSDRRRDPRPDSADGQSVLGRLANGCGEEFVQPTGRWPANIMFDEESAAMLDEQSGERPGMSGGGQHRADYPGGMFGGIDSTGTARGDGGGASRFFFTAKASRSDRDHGLIAAPSLTARELVGRDPDSAGAHSPRAGAGRTQGALRDHGRASGVGARNPHPTVKPLDLIEYLAKLILPPRRPDGKPRRLFVPFAGSGSEMIGALRAGWDEVVGIELEYGAIARERLSHADVAHQPDLFGGGTAA